MKISRRAFAVAAVSTLLADVRLSVLNAQDSPAPEQKGPFIHPGILHTREDLERMRAAVATGEQPIRAGFEMLAAHPESQRDYQVKGPAREIGRNPNVRNLDFDSDANAAYQCALMYCITGDPVFAAVSTRILNAWTTSLERISGADACLCAALGGFKLVNAAELMRSSAAGWSADQAAAAQRMFSRVFVPALFDFAPYANGNWDTAAIKMLLAVAVYTDDRQLFERALNYYMHGCGDGSLAHYLHADGQCQESGRDQQHAQLGIGHMGDCCEIAWNQGIDLFGAENNRLLAGFEYAAKYNLGYEVPFTPDRDQTGQYRHSLISPPSTLRPLYEQIYNHYVHRAGLSAPFTTMAAAKLRPEGAAFGADHPGFGTLLWTCKPIVVSQHTRALPSAVAGLRAMTIEGKIRLDWLPAREAVSYRVRRIHSSSSSKLIAHGIADPSFTDSSVKPHTVYRYSVSAVNEHGEGTASLWLVYVPSLPAGWTQVDLGAPAAAGDTKYDGSSFRVSGGGHAVGGELDQMHFVSGVMGQQGSISARYCPQLASQFASFGLWLRDGAGPSVPAVALLINRDPSVPGRGGWRVSLLCRNVAGATAEALAAYHLADPVVSYGRLVGFVALRLTRTAQKIMAAFSQDGKTWDELTSIPDPFPPNVSGGIGVCSGLEDIATAVMFDQVVIG